VHTSIRRLGKIVEIANMIIEPECPIIDGFTIDDFKNIMLQSEVSDMAADPVAQTMLEKADAMVELKRPKILVVDDEPMNVELFEAQLGAAGYEVVTASSGEEALKKVEGEKPDLILLDAVMPDLNGFDIIKILRGKAETLFIPVVMVTALNEMRYKIQAIESGVDNFLTKPVNSLELITQVKSLLRIKYMYNELMERKISPIRAEKESFKRELREKSQDSLDAEGVSDYVALLNKHINGDHQVTVVNFATRT
jgi:DNA-binding response OmpR family regulator